MGKQAVTYNDLTKILMKEAKEEAQKSGKPFSAKDVMQKTGGVWKTVKSGSHPKYEAKTGAGTRGPRKTRKVREKIDSEVDSNMEKILKKVKLCPVCKDAVNAALNKTKKRRSSRGRGKGKGKGKGKGRGRGMSGGDGHDADADAGDEGAVSDHGEDAADEVGNHDEDEDVDVLVGGYKKKRKSGSRRRRR